MALPSGVTTCTVTVGSSIALADGTDVSIKASVTPVYGGNAHALVWSATGQSLVDFPASQSADGGMMVTFVLPHVDQTGFVDGSGNAVTMWAYRFNITVSNGSQSISYTKSLQPLVGQSTVDLDLVPDGQITSQVSAPVPAVLSVNGQTGNVTVTGGGGTADWNTLANKPAVIAAGADQPTARAAIGAGTSNLAVGTAHTDAMAGDTAIPATPADIGAATATQGAKADTAIQPATLTADLATKADLVSGKVPVAQIPAQALTEYLGNVADQTAMLALTGQPGDFCTRTDTSTTWVITGADPSQLANWLEQSGSATPTWDSIQGKPTTFTPTIGTTANTALAGNTAYVPPTRLVAGHALSADVTLAKGDVGLGNVDNTADTAKPVSTATQTALNLKVNTADQVTLARVAPGSTLTIQSTTTWPARPTARTDVSVIWLDTGALGTQPAGALDGDQLVAAS